MIAHTVAAITHLRQGYGGQAGRRIHHQPWRRRLARSFFLLTSLTLPATAQLDTNASGMSDVWERHFNRDNPGQLFDPQNPNHAPHADPDHDGWTNLQESIAGTDPFDAKPPVGIVATHVSFLKDQEEPPSPEFPEGRFVDVTIISWNTLPGKEYTLKTSPDLSAESWIAIGTPISGDGTPAAMAITLTDIEGLNPERLFWRVHIHDPLSDTDGDGLTDYEEFLLGSNPYSADTSGDGVPDGWLVIHGFNPTHDHTNILFPGTAITVPDAHDMGVQAHPDATPEDHDGDGVPNEMDADPDDAAIKWRRVPESSYLVLPVANAPQAESSEQPWLYRLGESGHILASRENIDEWDGVGSPPVEYFKTHIWNPLDSTWSELTLPANLRGIGTIIDANGNVYGQGVGALGPNDDFPGSVPAPIFWERNGAAWAVASSTVVGLGESFSTGYGAYAQFGWPEHVSALVPFGRSGRLEGSPLPPLQPVGELSALVERHGANGGPSTVLSGDGGEIIGFAGFGEALGWHAARWVENDVPENLFARLKDDGTLENYETMIPSAAALAQLVGLGAIHPDYLPDGADDIVLWQTNDQQLRIGTLTASGLIDWEISGKASAERLAGKINARGEGLDTTGSRLWRNGSWHDLSDLLPANHGWSEFQALDINNQGIILAKAEDDGVTKTGLLVPAGLIIDSDNTQGFEIPSATAEQRELQEWPQEDPLDPAFPGKILLVNSGDEDGDGIPDFADGIDVFEEDGFRYPETAPDRAETARLVPIVLKLITPFADIETLPVRFQYDASDPAEITKSGTPEATVYEPAPGSLRLWKRSESGHQFGDEEDPSPIRLIAPVHEEGDYIPPDTIITAADLGFSQDRDTVILYIESVRASEELRDQTITVEVDLDGSDGPLDFMPIGRVECTSIDVQLVQVQEDSTTNPVSAIEASTPVPELHVGQVEITNLAPSPDDTEITGTLTLSGTVSSFFADITPPNGPGTFEEVAVYLNGEEEPAAIIAVTGSKTDDANSHFRPYPFDGAFSATLQDIPLIEGTNEITVVAIDPIDGAEARVSHSVEILATSPFADINGGAGTDVLATLTLAFTAALDPEAPDTLIASLATPDGTATNIALTETGDATREFTDTQQAFTIQLHHGGDSFDPASKDVLIALVTHTTLAPAGLHFGTIRETDLATLIFTQALIDDSGYWQAEDYANFTFEVGPAVLTAASHPGTTVPYMLRLSGPVELLDFIDEIETADGPRKVEKSLIDDEYYVKMKNSKSALYLFKLIREATSGEHENNEERILALLDMIAADLDDEFQYHLGLAHGMWDGGADMVEGLYQLLKFAVEASAKWTPRALVIRWVNGDEFEAERKFFAFSGKTLKATFDLYMLLCAEQSAFSQALVTSLIAGDNKAINTHLEAMGDKYGSAIIAAAELLEALADHVQQLTPRERGYYMGRASFEIVTLVFAWEVKAAQLIGHAAKFSKANLLKALSNIPFFQTDNGLAAFNKLLAQGDYVTRLAGTKMNTRNFALFERGLKAQNNNPWAALTSTSQRFDNLPITDARYAKNTSISQRRR